MDGEEVEGKYLRQDDVGKQMLSLSRGEKDLPTTCLKR